ncbi:MAG: hypothetical protein EAZ57_06665 [Cytophagales bacterium]|nr:MAG: hypothetical protein EAZ67_07160 [Cytophagales bacterium]TAF60705.1 MAG: hypothetical protein EAZ57_06665 [Cytophagales bacterium]
MKGRVWASVIFTVGFGLLTTLINYCHVAYLGGGRENSPAENILGAVITGVLFFIFFPYIQRLNDRWKTK